MGSSFLVLRPVPHSEVQLGDDVSGCDVYSGVDHCLDLCQRLDCATYGKSESPPPPILLPAFMFIFSVNAVKYDILSHLRTVSLFSVAYVKH